VIKDISRRGMVFVGAENSKLLSIGTEPYAFEWLWRVWPLRRSNLQVLLDLHRLLSIGTNPLSAVWYSLRVIVA
jgi:hypothetical protein